MDSYVGMETEHSHILSGNVQPADADGDTQ